MVQLNYRDNSNNLVFSTGSLGTIAPTFIEGSTSLATKYAPSNTLSNLSSAYNAFTTSNASFSGVITVGNLKITPDGSIWSGSNLILNSTGGIPSTAINYAAGDQIVSGGFTASNTPAGLYQGNAFDF